MTPAAELARLIESLLQRSALIEFATLVACVVAAWMIVRVVQGRAPKPDSVWFGDRIVDGVLFPVLALALTLLARRLLEDVLPIALLRVAVPILVSLVAIRLTARVLRKAFPRSALLRVIERTVSWLAWIGVVLWVTGVLPVLVQELDSVHWKLGDNDVSLRNLIEGALSAVVVMVFALWVSAAIEAKLLRDADRADLSLRKIAANATRALLLFLGLMFALKAAGLDLTVLSVFGGALGVGIGFGLQKLASNYISGFVILAERSLRIGDWVKVDNFEGRILDISTRFTVIRALSGREANVPNEMLITQRVENYTRADPKVALTTAVQVPHGSDVEALRAPLAAAVAAVPRVLSEPAVDVQLSAFTLHGIELTVQFFIDDALAGTANVKSDANRAVLRTLAAAGVPIAHA